MRRFIIVCHVAMLLLHVCDNKKYLVQVADREPSVGEGIGRIKATQKYDLNNNNKSI